MSAELAGHRPPELPDGTCITTRLEDGSLRVDHADPEVLISAELLDHIEAGDQRGVSLRVAAPSGPARYVGSVLRIEAVNRTVIYEVTGYAWTVNGYTGRWPDLAPSAAQVGALGELRPGHVVRRLPEHRDAVAVLRGH